MNDSITITDSSSTDPLSFTRASPHSPYLNIPHSATPPSILAALSSFGTADQIKELYMTDCNLSSAETCLAVGLFIENNAALERVILDGSIIHDVTVEYIARQVACSASMQELSINCTNLDNDVIVTIDRCLRPARKILIHDRSIVNRLPPPRQHSAPIMTQSTETLYRDAKSANCLL